MPFGVGNTEGAGKIKGEGSGIGRMLGFVSGKTCGSIGRTSIAD